MSDSASRLPAHPSLEQLQKRAKELLKQHRAGDNAARQRFGATTPQREVTLADAQFVIAREHGFESWAKLKHHIGAHAYGSAPPFCQIDWKENRLTTKGPRSENDWEAIFALMEEHGITSVEAGGIADAALKRLAQIDHITNLSVTSDALTDEGVKHLASMPQLLELEIGGPQITDRGLEVFRNLPELRRFKSCWTQGISDDGAANLASCELLESVNLMGTATGDGLIRALAGKPNLRRLKTGRGVTDAGIKPLHHIPAFKKWSGREIRYGLMSAESEPTDLMIDGPFTDSGLADLVGLDGLFGLSFFWHCPAFTSAGLAPLRLLPNLGFLGCQGSHCDDEAMRQITAIPRLQMLMGQGAVAGDEGWEALSRSPTIEYIWGRDCPNFTGRGFAALAAMPALRGIAISCRHVDDVSLAALPSFPSLREIMPMDVPDAGFRHIGRCENLEGLWCMYCRDTGDTATEHISRLSRLKTYYAGKTQITDRSLEILSRMDSLERLEFWACPGITDAGVSRLAVLPKLREITFNSSPDVSRDVVSLFSAQVHVKYSG